MKSTKNYTEVISFRVTPSQAKYIRAIPDFSSLIRSIVLDYLKAFGGKK